MLFPIAAALALALVWLVRPTEPSRSASTGTTSSSPFPIASDTAPQHLGSIYLCQSGPFAAYASGRHYFPPNHPLHPASDVKPDACFRTAAQAEAANYSLALVPQGTFEIGGIYLVPAEPSRQCERAARLLGFAVPCPSTLPSRAPGSARADCTTYSGTASSPCVWQGAFVLEYGSFGVPPDYHAIPNLVITALPEGPLPADSEIPYWLTCPEAKHVASTQISTFEDARPISARYLLCPDAPPPQSGQLILRWTRGGVTYSVSLHGDSPTNRAVLLHIASSIQYVTSSR